MNTYQRKITLLTDKLFGLPTWSDESGEKETPIPDLIDKDENNPFYNQKKAENQGLSFFMIRKCSPYLLRILEEKGMLADAQAKSLAGEERSKAIVHENWEFLMRYFLREY